MKGWDSNYSTLINIGIAVFKLPRFTPEIKQTDINPLLAKEKQGAVVDARIIRDRLNFA